MAIPYITIQLDKPRRLRFGMGCMLFFEQTTGLKLRDIDADLSMDITAKLLWAMLRQDDPELTLADVCRIVDEHASSLAVVVKAFGEAVASKTNCIALGSLRLWTPSSLVA